MENSKPTTYISSTISCCTISGPIKKQEQKKKNHVSGSTNTEESKMLVREDCRCKMWGDPMVPREGDPNADG